MDARWCWGLSLGDVVVLDGPITIVGPGERFGDRDERPDPCRGDGLDPWRRAGCGDREGRTGRDDRRGRASRTSRSRLAGRCRCWAPCSAALAIAFGTAAGRLALLAGPGAARRRPCRDRSPFRAARLVAWGIVLVDRPAAAGCCAVGDPGGVPLGLSLLLALALVFLVGATWSIWSVGRALVRDPRSRWLAFLAGWAIAVAVSLVPYLNVGGVDRGVDLRARRHDGGRVAGPRQRRTSPRRLRRDPRAPNPRHRSPAPTPLAPPPASEPVETTPD